MWDPLIEQPTGDFAPGEWTTGFVLGARDVSDGASQAFAFTHGASSASAMLLAFRVPDLQASGTVRGTAAAALTTSIPIAATGIVQATSAAGMTAAPTLAAVAIAAATGTANLTTQVRLAGSASAAVVGAANPTFQSNVFLNATGSIAAAAAADLVAQTFLRSDSVGRVNGAAVLDKPVPLEAVGDVDSSSIASFSEPFTGQIRMTVRHRRILMTAS